MSISATVPQSQPAASRTRGRVAWQAPKATDGPAGGSSGDSGAAVPAAPEPTPFRRGRTSRPELAVAELLRRGDGYDICGYTSGSNDAFTCGGSSSVCAMNDGVFGCCTAEIGIDDCLSSMPTACVASTDVDDDADVDSMAHTCTGASKTECITLLQAYNVYSVWISHYSCGTEDLTITLEADAVSMQSSSSQTSSSSGTGLTQLDPTTRHSTTSNIFATYSTTSAKGTHSTNKTGEHTASGLSAGAIGGISAGAFVLLVALLAMIWRMTKRRQMSNLAAASQTSAFGGSGGGSGLKGGPIAGAMAVGVTGGAYQQVQQQHEDQMQQHLLADDNSGAAGGNPVSHPPAPAWGIPGGNNNYYPMQDQRSSVYDGAGYGPGGPPQLYDPQAAAAGAALPANRPYQPQTRPAEM